MSSRPRDENGAKGFEVVALVSIGAVVVVVAGAAKKDAAIVLKSGVAEFVEPAARKLNSEELVAGIAPVFAAGPS